MNNPAQFLRAGFRTRDLWLALVLGAGGFFLNMLELQLGWGLHFMFGNALVFAFIRVLCPQCFVLAASISSLRSVFLWHHLWAWGIWTLEAATVAYSSRKTSPVRNDVIFWVLLGTPLVVVTYGAVMHMDQLSLLLVIVKQATNGVLNVVIGELCYLAALGLYSPLRSANWPKMPIESFVMAILLAIILIPTTVYLSIDAPAREQAARADVDAAMQRRLQITGATVSVWAQSRSVVLKVLAERQPAGTGVQLGGLPADLSREFSEISAFAGDGTLLWSTAASSSAQGALRQLASGNPGTRPAARLASVGVGTGAEGQQSALVVPCSASGRPVTIVALMRRGALQRLVAEVDGTTEESTFLANPEAGILPLGAVDPGALMLLEAMPAEMREAALKDAILLSQVGYGKSLMSDLRDARMARAQIISELPDWQVLTVARLSPGVLKAREGQLYLFTALTGFVLLITLLASALSKRMENSLRRLAQSAADLAVLGTKRETIDSLVITELNEISGKIASASSTVSEERGALATYERRLNSISQHAPIIVYAMDVLRGHRKAGLVYVSEALEAILGYTRDEAEVTGWWSHAVHPDDYERCVATFADLQCGQVVQAEYRLRHKRGHYVWVYDTLSVEASVNAQHFEAVGVLIDISERKAAAEQLLQADKMASLGRMIAGTAHELNQPLNFIKMAASNLREHARRGPMDAERLTGKLESILTQVNRASEIILQMRVFGRTPKEVPFPMDIKTAVDAVALMAKPQLELDGTRVDTSACEADVTVRALPVLLEQVLLNLFLNANDAIRARQQSRDPAIGEIRVGVTSRGRMAIVTVEDNGTGLSAEILPAIFEPFFTTKPPKEGTGLGLSISYGIIKDLGGTIRGENIENGARFTVELPLAT